MSKNTKRAEYKKYIALVERRSQLWKIQDDLGYRELEKPYHYGFNHYYVLREDVARRLDADVFQTMVDRYYTTTWSKDGNVIVKYRRYTVNRSPVSRYISERDYDVLETKYKKFFYRSYKEDRKMWDGSIMKYYYCMIPHHYLVLKTEKNYLTHEKVIDGEVERELAFVNDQISEIHETLNPFNEESLKRYVRTRNRSDRRCNKQAMKNLLLKGDVEDEVGDFSYRHRNGAKWDYY